MAGSSRVAVLDGEVDRDVRIGLCSGQTGGRPAAAKDLGFTSAYVFGAVCPGEGKAAAVIMPICNTIAMNDHLREISSQVGTAAHALLVLDGAGWH